MDDLDLNLNETPVEPDAEKPIPFDDSDDGPAAQISHAPLNLGGSGTEVKAGAAPRTPKQKVASSEERITGVKTFFTKLHAGAIEFLDEQISEWLMTNPEVVIKRTNVAVGEVAAKKTEPNLIITVWY